MKSPVDAVLYPAGNIGLRVDLIVIFDNLAEAVQLGCRSGFAGQVEIFGVYSAQKLVCGDDYLARLEAVEDVLPQLVVEVLLYFSHIL